MKIRNLFFILGSVSLLAFGIFLMLLFNVNPFRSDFLTIAIFFLSIFVFLATSLTVLGWWFRVQASNREIIYAHLPISFRQAFLFSFWITAMFVLSALKVLTIWDAGILFTSMLFIELFFRTRTTR